MIEHCTIIELPKISDQRGSLTFLEADNHIPFQINRIYYLYDIPGDSTRGGHAHKELQQLIIPISGSFDIHLDDGYAKKTMRMTLSNQGLYVCPMIWRDIDHFSPGAVCLVLASLRYSEADYYREYQDFMVDVTKGVRR